MRILLFLVLSSLMVLGGYWVFAAQMIERQVATQISAAPQLSGTARSVAGFPLSFRQVIAAPQWRSRDGQKSWSAPELTLQAPSYLPNQITALFPRNQSLQSGSFATALQTSGMTGLLTIGTDRTLRKAHLEIDTATLTPPLAVEWGQGLAFGLQQTEATVYNFDARADDLRFGPDFAALLSPDMTGMGAEIDDLKLIGTAEFMAPLPVGAAWPGLSAISLSHAHLHWGALQITANGAMERSAAGTFDGQIALQIADWQPLLGLLQHHEMLAPDAVFMAGLFFASQSEPGTNRLTLPLEIRDSLLVLGPFVLFQLPAF